MLNLFVLQGRLTRDTELKEANSGVKYGHISLAVLRNKSKPGEDKKTDFFDISVFGKTAEAISKYFSKGDQILLQGEVQLSTYEKDGSNVKQVQLIANEFNFVESKKQENKSKNKDDDDILFN